MVTPLPGKSRTRSRLPAPLRQRSRLLANHHPQPTPRTLTPFLLITYIQAMYFHALTHSFARRRAAIPFAPKSLRTLSIATGVYPFRLARPSRFSDSLTFGPSDHQAYGMKPLLVRSYFADLNRFCIPSPIVPVPPSRLHCNFASGGFPLNGSERRTTQRFQMRLPLTVRWTTGAAVGETSTESRDVSSRGVYFFLAKDVKEGSAVEILLTLPNEITLAGPVRVRCLGRVQRTEARDEGAIGVVAAIERYEFLRGDEDKL
jgi:hypothetical protein